MSTHIYATTMTSNRSEVMPYVLAHYPDMAGRDVQGVPCEFLPLMSIIREPQGAASIAVIRIPAEVLDSMEGGNVLQVLGTGETLEAAQISARENHPDLYHQLWPETRVDPETGQVIQCPLLFVRSQE